PATAAAEAADHSIGGEACGAGLTPRCEFPRSRKRSVWARGGSWGIDLVAAQPLAPAAAMRSDRVDGAPRPGNPCTVGDGAGGSGAAVGQPAARARQPAARR